MPALSKRGRPPGLSAAAALRLHCRAQAAPWLWRAGFSGCRTQSGGHAGVHSHGARALAQGLRSRGGRAQLPCGMRDLLGPGIELVPCYKVSPAWQAGFLTPGPPGELLSFPFL